MNILADKTHALEEYLRSIGSVAIAFSGGVDSTFLLKTAHNVLGDNVLAITARSLSFPKRELEEASEFCRINGICHIIVDSEELDIDGFSQNPPNRCYLCKSELFHKIRRVAEPQGIFHIAEGSNTDDDGDYRPGLQAVAELGIHSPLRHAKLSKEEIRTLSRDAGLPTWDKQSFACLSSRFSYGEEITADRLEIIDQAEQYLLDIGFRQVRVRYHGNLARIELDETEFDRLSRDIRNNIHNRFSELGFTFIALDILGYRTGSMNATLA